jgi:hypothetical protein
MRLPLSGATAQFRPLTGLDEAAVAELDRSSLQALGDVASRFGVVSPGELAVSDFDRLCLALHVHLHGDDIQGHAQCVSCGGLMTISFGAGDYLTRIESRLPSGVSSDGGWFRFDGEDLSFRVPTLDDLREAANETDPDEALLRRCSRPAQLPPGARDRIQQALELIAPVAAGPIAGSCPRCSSEIDLLFDPCVFVLSEIGDSAAFLFEEVDLLASRYHWREDEVLALTSDRRRAYVDAARRAGA